MINIIFRMKLNIKVFYKEAVSFSLVIATYTQSTQNSKFVISFAISQKKKGGMKLIFAWR